jgi:hypothetical protein
MKSKRLSVDLGFLLLTILLSTCFGAFLSRQRVTDPFLYYDIAFVKSIQQETQMVIPETGPYASLSFVAGREILLTQFANMMGIGPKQLQFLPLGTILLSSTLYFLALRLLKSPVIAGLVTLYLILNLSHATALYSVFGYALALPLFFGFVAISKRFFQRRGQFEIVILLLLFVAAHFIHYTIAVWMILFLIGASLTIGIQKWLTSNSYAVKAVPAYYLAIALGVFFLGLNETVYKSFLPLVQLETLDSAAQRFLTYLSIDPTSINRSPYLYTRSSAIGLISTCSLVIILLPIVLGVIQDVWQLIVRRSFDRATASQLPIMWGISLMGVIDSVSYAFRGSISTKSFSMILPLVTLLYVQRTGKRTLHYGMALLLVMTSIVKLVVFYDNSYVIGPGNITSNSDKIQPSAEWLQSHIPRPKYTMLADMNLYGKYLVASVGRGQEPILYGYTTERFENVIGVSTEEWETVPDIVAVDLVSFEPTTGFVWVRLNPLVDYQTKLRNNHRLNLIYDDGAVWLCQPTGE